MIKSSWAIVLCKFSADMSATPPIDYYKNLFTGQGAGSFNMTDFFSDMSHGQLDLTQSEVFGWFAIPIKDKAEYDSYDAMNAQDPSIPKSRPHLIDVVRQTAAQQNVDLTKFDGLVICMNGPMDYFGVTGGMVAVLEKWSARQSTAAHEMTHGYGLDHSRIDGSTADYQDPWDTMSSDTTYEAPNGNYHAIGPGLNAANMRALGWLDESRVWTATGGAADTTIELRPLHRRDLTGYLAADLGFGEFLVEYRERERWDGGIPRPVVLVHRFEDNHSYLMPGPTEPYLAAGDVFQLGDEGNPFSAFRRVEVVSIDDSNEIATLKIKCRPGLRLPVVGGIYGTVVGGVPNDGDGGIIINGVFHRIPPWNPLLEVVAQIAAYQSADAIRDVGIRYAAKRSALKQISSRLAAIATSLSPYRVPGPPLKALQAPAQKTKKASKKK